MLWQLSLFIVDHIQSFRTFFLFARYIIIKFFLLSFFGCLLLSILLKSLNQIPVHTFLPFYIYYTLIIFIWRLLYFPCSFIFLSFFNHETLLQVLFTSQVRWRLYLFNWANTEELCRPLSKYRYERRRGCSWEVRMADCMIKQLLTLRFDWNSVLWFTWHVLGEY